MQEFHSIFTGSANDAKVFERSHAMGFKVGQDHFFKASVIEVVNYDCRPLHLRILWLSFVSFLWL